MTSVMYMAAANEMTRRRIFDVPELAKVIRKYREYMGEETTQNKIREVIRGYNPEKVRIGVLGSHQRWR
jgi:hypothetical protein